MDKKTTGSNPKDTKEKKKEGLLKRFAKKPLWYRVFMVTSAIIIVILLSIIAYAYHLMSLVNHDPGPGNIGNENNPTSEFFETEENPEDYTHLPEASIVDSEHEGDGRSEPGIYNILLMGLDRDSGNLSDSMIVVTIDTKNKALKLTSFMRDILIPIPGYSTNRINTVFRNGGIELIKEVFANSFDICIDGYVAVNYADLTKVIDQLGGVTIYMTEQEAKYLNTSNYISDERYRNLDVYTGMHWLNGAQATGYARVRYVDKGSESDDFARTARQRQILNAIYEQFKDQNLTQLLQLMETVLPMVSTSLTIPEMTEIATKAVASGILSSEIEQFRVPTNSTFKLAMYKGMSILEIDFEENTKEIHKFIFGDEEDETETKTETETKPK